MTSQKELTLQHLTVKQVNSGDSIVCWKAPNNGPPKDINIILTNILAPKLARPVRSSANREDNKEPNREEIKEDDFAWDAREFIRKKLIGKKVCLAYELIKRESDQSGPNEKTGEKRELVFGCVYNGPDTSCENIAESLVAEGLVDVKTPPKPSDYVKKLLELEEAAKKANKGKHMDSSSVAEQRRRLYVISDAIEFKDKHQYAMPAVVEHVMDGSTLKVILFDSAKREHYYAKVNLSGIRCNSSSEDYTAQAKFFTESRLLQRDVEIRLEHGSKDTFYGTVYHPKGNIAELLLKEGFAKCVKWNFDFMEPQQVEKLKAAELEAKQKKLRLWKNYAPSNAEVDAKDKEYQGKVVEIFNADAMNIKLSDGSIRKIFLSSIRPPPRMEPGTDSDNKKPPARFRPLFDVPFMFEAREFLRKKLIGKKVNIAVDYVQAPSNNFPEKNCCTVTIGGINVAAALIGKGLATAVKYREDNDQRSAHYEELISAETKAKKTKKGLHSSETNSGHRVVDLSGDLKLSKQYFPIIQRGGKTEAIVEFVASGSRLRLFLPRQNYLLVFLLGGITCARASRDASVPGEPYGDEALNYTKDLCLQREVVIEAEAQDKHGSFIGWLWIDNCNLSEKLVQEGFAQVHSTAFRSAYGRTLEAVQEQAQKKKLRMWEKYEPVELEPKDEPKERVIKEKTVTITEVKDEPSTDLIFYAQHFDEGPHLEELMSKLRQEMIDNPPVPGAYVPKKGDLCAAKFSQDDLWYRARVTKIQGKDIIISFVDYGNKEKTQATQLASLPAAYSVLPSCAREYALAFVTLPKDPDSCDDARNAFYEEINGVPKFSLNVEYKVGIPYVTLKTFEGNEDIGRKLIEKGFVLAEKRKEKKYEKIIKDYASAQEKAKKNRENLWVYGDITEDDAKEFG